MIRTLLILLALSTPVMAQTVNNPDEATQAKREEDKNVLIQQIREGHRRYHPQAEVDPSFGSEKK